MSTLFGAIRQLGYVVDDIEAAMEHWSSVLRVGPWYYNPKVPIDNYTYDGRRYEPHNSVALANSGYLQVELIQTRNDVPSMYRDFRASGQRGLQHVAYWTTRFDDALAEAGRAGFRVKMSGEVGENGRFVYFAGEAHPGSTVELSEVLGPKGRLFDLIRRESEAWDGREPVRPFPDLATL
ncbi:MAG: VOC family protein [Alphaproteobacteria bacterium]|nr:VOC family protein [Alphaproteobacteria bacterium]